jgi:hypothetical protein
MNRIFVFLILSSCLFSLQATNYYKAGNEAADVLINIVPVIAPLTLPTKNVTQLLSTAKKQVTEDNLSSVMPLVVAIAILKAQAPTTRAYQKALKNFKAYYKGFVHRLSTTHFQDHIEKQPGDKEFKERLKLAYRGLVSCIPFIENAKSFKEIEQKARLTGRALGISC